MTLRPRSLTAAVLAVALAAATPAAAQESEGPGPSERAREGAEQILDALRGLLQMMPRYGMPRVEEDGDIVIPRLDDPDGETPQGDGPENGPGDDGGGEDTRPAEPEGEATQIGI